MNVASLESIDAALGMVDAKKNSLKRAFDELQSRSHLLSSFSMKWADIDFHFTALHSEILAQFEVIQALESKKPSKPENVKDMLLVTAPVPAKPEMKTLCEKMDGLGLRQYVIEHRKERAAIGAELVDAFKHSPDPGSMVLDALEGFWNVKMQLASRVRSVCVMLLEELMRSGLQITPEARERAIDVAADWKVKMAIADAGDGTEDEEGREPKEERGGVDRLAYLQLLATYKLMNEDLCDLNELVDCVARSSGYRQIIELCHILGLDSKITDVVQRLIGVGKHLLALKFIFEFGLTDEFPPVPLLKAYVLNCHKISQKVCKSGKSSNQSLNDAAGIEIATLKMVIRCIEDHGLESQYPKDELMARIDRLKKEKAARRKPTSSPTKPKQQLKKPRLNGNKKVKKASVPYTSDLKLHASTIIPLPQHLIAQRGLLLADPNPASPYIDSSRGAYDATVPFIADSANLDPSAGIYGLSGPHRILLGNGNPSISNLYSGEANPRHATLGYSGYDGQYLHHESSMRCRY